MERLTKQIIYGLFYLIILILIVVGAYYLIRGRANCSDGKLNQKEEAIDCGGPPVGGCMPCALKNKQPLQTSAVEIFSAGTDKVTAIALLINLNKQLGIKQQAYTLNLYDSSGQKIYSTTKDIFINPDNRHYIIEAGIEKTANQVARGEIVLGEENWELVELTGPLVSLVGTVTEIKDNKITVTGRVKNANDFKISRAEVQTVLYNSLKFRMAASKTLVRDIESNSEKEFVVTTVVRPDLMASVDFGQKEILVEAQR